MTILNLASDESSAAVRLEQHYTFKIVFRQERRVIAFHAKIARGLMVRYLAEHRVATLEDIRNFNCERYTFQPQDLRHGKELVFDRPKNWKK
jgi:cytoplasmic iron level regulating protein YaaA (DUF328/UPF0246 family)